MAGLFPPTTTGWDPTVTPAPPPKGLLESFGDRFNNTLSNPMFQFGMGMMGAGSEGKGLGGGLFAGSQQAGNAFKMAQQQRELAAQKQRDAFIQSLDDPNNPIAKNFSPETLATLKGLPPDQSSALLAQMLSRKGDLSQAEAIARIQANAQVGAKNAELKYQRDYDRENTGRIMDMLRNQIMPGQEAMPGAPSGAPAAPAPPPGAHPRPQSQAEVQSLPPGTVWQAPDGSLRIR